MTRWFLICMSLAISFAFSLMAVGGLYFFTLKENQVLRDEAKSHLFYQNKGFSQELRSRLLVFAEEAERLVVSRPSTSDLFQAFSIIDLETGHIQNLSLNETDSKIKNSDQVLKKGISQEMLEEFQLFSKKVKQKSFTSSVWLGFSDKKKKKLLVVFNEFPNSWKGPRDLRIVGLVDSRQVFQFSKSSTKFFVASKKNILFKNQESLNKNLLFKLLNVKQNKAHWYAAFPKEKRTNNLFHVYPFANLFLMSEQSLSEPLIVWTSESGSWLLFCLLGFIILSCLILIFVSPLLLAYKKIKLGFIEFSKTGEVPFLAETNNPFLYFYKNWSLLLANKKLVDKNEDSSSVLSQSFQDVLDKEVEKLRQKHVGLILKKDLHSDIKLFYFYGFMKKILREILSNALDSMGGVFPQELQVSSWEEKGHFVFSVRDQGVGLHEEDLKKPFELYYSTKNKSGVGLNVVQSLVSANKGTVELLPLDKGVKVQVSLPFQCFLQVNQEISSDEPLKEKSVFSKNKEDKSHSFQAPH